MNLYAKLLAIVSLSLAVASAHGADANLKFEAIEKSVGGRLGVFAAEVDGKKVWSYRADEKFMMCSTFKWLLGAQILDRVEKGHDKLSREIKVPTGVLIKHSPVTEKHKGQTMTIEALNEAAIGLSDNTAANLLLEASGGPKALTQFIKGLGFKDTHLDRFEPELNQPAPGQELDVTTPKDMALILRRLLFSEGLKESSKMIMRSWLLGAQTGAKRLKAGLPKDWQIGHKTGSCNDSYAHDVGFLIPPEGSPIVVAVYLSDAKARGYKKEAALSEVAALISSKNKSPREGGD